MYFNQTHYVMKGILTPLYSNIKYIFCLFVTFGYVYLKSVHFRLKSQANISHYMCYVLGLNFDSSFMWKCFTYFKYGRVLESVVSYPSSITLIESSHKCTRILFIIFNSKPGIWLFIQPTIDVNSQYNSYDVLTLYHTIIFP